MNDELQRINSALTENANRISAEDIEPAEAARLAEEIARLAGEAVKLLSAELRDRGPRPDPPGQSRLPVEES